MKFETAKLGDCVTIKGGGTPSRKKKNYWNGPILWASVKDFVSTELKTTLESITEEGLQNSSTNLIPENTIIIPTRMALGKVAINAVPMAINQDLKALFISDINRTYGPYLMKYLLFRANYIKRNGSGATVKGITLEFLKSITIPLPPLETQKRIVELLDRAQALIDKRKEQIALMDQLIQSLFYDMFGDPVLNPMGWECKDLSSFSEIKSGVTKGCKFNGKETTFVPYMRVANVQDGYLKLDDISKIEVLHSDITKYQLQKNDILLTEGGDPDKLGRGAIWHGEIENCIHQNHIFRIRLSSNEMIPEYASMLISSARGKRYFLKSAKQTTGIASINITQLKKCPMLIPPLELQKTFAEHVKNIESQKETMTTSLHELENNFNSLMQRAFKGELI